MLSSEIRKLEWSLARKMVPERKAFRAAIRAANKLSESRYSEPPPKELDVIERNYEAASHALDVTREKLGADMEDFKALRRAKRVALRLGL